MSARGWTDNARLTSRRCPRSARCGTRSRRQNSPARREDPRTPTPKTTSPATAAALAPLAFIAPMCVRLRPRSPDISGWQAAERHARGGRGARRSNWWSRDGDGSAPAARVRGAKREPQAETAAGGRPSPRRRARDLVVACRRCFFAAARQVREPADVRRARSTSAKASALSGVRAGGADEASSSSWRRAAIGASARRTSSQGCGSGLHRHTVCPRTTPSTRSASSRAITSCTASSASASSRASAASPGRGARERDHRRRRLAAAVLHRPRAPPPAPARRPRRPRSCTRRRLVERLKSGAKPSSAASPSIQRPQGVGRQGAERSRAHQAAP